MKRLPEVLLILIGLAIAIASLPYRSLFPFDDTFITFRYAANFANGHGLVWNIGGPHTEGFTNFLFVVLLSGCAFLHAPLLESSQAISILATIVTSVTLYRTIAHVTESVSERKVLWPSMLGALLYLSDPFVWYNAWSGMETSLFVMLIVLSIASLQKAAEDSNFRWSFVFAVAAALTRPEGALMVAIALLVLLLSSTDKKRTLTDALIWGVLPLVVYAFWKYWYFGDLLPNSFYVKALQPQSRLESHLHGLAGLKTFYLGILLLPILAYTALFLKPKTENRLPRAALASLLWVALITGFYLFPEPMQPNYDRFFLSIQVVLVIPACLAIVFLSSRIKKRALRFVGLLAIILLHSYATLEVRHAHAYITRDATFDHRYEEIAEIFHSIPDHEAITLAWGDAGKLPYYSGMKHIDVVGLNTNAIAHAKNVDQVLDYLSNARPDMLIIPTVTGSGDSDSCAEIIRWGHGLIGHFYPRLATYGAFGEFQLFASLPQSVYDLNLLVDPKSPHFEDIKRTILPLIGKNPIVRPAPHCMK